MPTLTAPPAVTAGQIIDTTAWGNVVRAAIQDASTALANFDAWTAYTPTWTNVTLGTGGVSAGGYMKIGKLVHFYAKVDLGTGGAVTGAVTVSFPVAAADPLNGIHLEIRGLDSGVAWRDLAWFQSSVSAVNVCARNTGGTYGYLTQIGATVPHTWGIGDSIYVAGWYMAA